MIGLLFRLFRILNRDKPVTFKPTNRYRVTLDMGKVRPGTAGADLGPWLARMGFSATAKPDVWKVFEQNLGRVPKQAILKTEKL